MKYWKFKSGIFFQFLLFTDDKKLLFGTFNEKVVDSFISSIDEQRKVPKKLKGIALSHIESVRIGSENRIINITLKSRSEESISFNSTAERDLVFCEIKSQLAKFQEIEIDFTKHYKKQFMYNCLSICISFAVIWFISDSIVSHVGLGGYTTNGIFLGGFIKILLVLAGKMGLVGLAMILVGYQFLKLWRHLKRDSKVIKLKKK